MCLAITLPHKGINSPYSKIKQFVSYCFSKGEKTGCSDLVESLRNKYSFMSFECFNGFLKYLLIALEVYL